MPLELDWKEDVSEILGSGITPQLGDLQAELLAFSSCGNIQRDIESDFWTYLSPKAAKHWRIRCE